jgi:hypothetical protein
MVPPRIRLAPTTRVLTLAWSHGFAQSRLQTSSTRAIRSAAAIAISARLEVHRLTAVRDECLIAIRQAQQSVEVEAARDQTQDRGCVVLRVV